MNNKSLNKIPLKASCIALSFLFLLSACGGSASPNSASSSAQTVSTAKIKITAAENFYGEAAKAVGGDRVEVTSVLNNPSVDPHDYEPTPDVARTVSNSKIIVLNGVGYDEWMEKLVNADPASKSKSVIKVADDVMGKKAGDNPHVWYDPETMPKLANKIADELTKLDPSGDQNFHKNAQAYITSLDSIKAKIQKLKQSGAKIAVSETIFDYMAAAMNLTINNTKFGKAINDGNDPSPADIAQMQEDIKSKAVKLFVYDIQNTSPTVDNIVKMAKSSGVPIVEVTETEPEGKNYVKWMTDILDNIGKALGIQ
ncbi:zinc ABC transporter substrate-binding protein [Paenibacillus sp. GP183]|uniref:metal ABC transporter solute-binding protein, Zn/Mn family n=1 Tax=Paenibacillus sp. GP183 TaxID=1882751 RepID=UPI00089C7E75|nr:zinc ABC transporter substrate-binding protein [Paenibacillus sp. GP183]SEB61607.1 zinc/manganese transport system substrate-binding protein [Paenibacillus sp. GP183]